MIVKGTFSGDSSSFVSEMGWDRSGFVSREPSSRAELRSTRRGGRSSEGSITIF